MKKLLLKIFPINPFKKKWEYQLFFVLGPFILFAFTMSFLKREYLQFSMYDYFVLVGQFWILGSIFFRLLYAEKRYVNKDDNK